MICPMMSNPETGFENCGKGGCAWWTGEQCAVTAIAKKQTTMSIDRTLKEAIMGAVKRGNVLP